MAKNKKETITAENRVEVFVPRGGEKEDPNLQIAINGKNYLLPRGKKSLVPPAVAEEYERSVRATDAWYETRSAIKESSKTPEG